MYLYFLKAITFYCNYIFQSHYLQRRSVRIWHGGVEAEGRDGRRPRRRRRRHLHHRRGCRRRRRHRQVVVVVVVVAVGHDDHDAVGEGGAEEEEEVPSHARQKQPGREKERETYVVRSTIYGKNLSNWHLFFSLSLKRNSMQRFPTNAQKLILVGCKHGSMKSITLIPGRRE